LSSQRLIGRSPDLKRLRDEGYDVAVVAGRLVVRSVPYVDRERSIQRGVIVSELTLAGDVTARPSTHVISFAGNHPCSREGVEIDQIRHSVKDERIDDSLTVNRSFSAKPPHGYADYYDKVTSYVRILEAPAQSLDPDVTARVFPAIRDDEEQSVFEYIDTASSRSGTSELAAKLAGLRIGIVGVGGTGSYVLDFVAKTPVREIRLFDDDVFSQHNAFRAPGAASREELQQRLRKVAYFKDKYSKMHRGIVAVEARLGQSNLEVLQGLDFVFLCLDKGGAKAPIVEMLERSGVPFIDVGMGIELVNGALLGTLRVTTSTPAKRDHVRTKRRIHLGDRDGDDHYARNIQIAELNALNAALAVIRWKKHFGFYHDPEREHHSTYTIDGNATLNEDRL
jgi:hypothetical protein